MRRVHLDLGPYAEILKDLLIEEGFDATVLRERSTGRVFGVWVPDDEYEEAQALAKRFGQGEPFEDAVRPAWRCPTCREPREGQFAVCWKCGRPRPA